MRRRMIETIGLQHVHVYYSARSVDRCLHESVAVIAWLTFDRVAEQFCQAHSYSCTSAKFSYPSRRGRHKSVCDRLYCEQPAGGYNVAPSHHHITSHLRLIKKTICAFVFTLNAPNCFLI